MSEREHIIKSLAEMSIDIEHETLDVPLEVFAQEYDDHADYYKNHSIEELRELYKDAFPVEEDHHVEEDLTDIAEINRFIDWMKEVERRPGELSACGRFIRLPKDHAASDDEVSFA